MPGAKTEFANGTPVPSHFLNSIFGGGAKAAWAASTAYTRGQVVKPTTPNDHVYICTSAGTSDSSEPSWPTGDGATVTDGGVTWKEHGGHRHDGAGQDGSAPKVALASGAEVQGELPWANIVEFASRASSFDPTIVTVPSTSTTLSAAARSLYTQKLKNGWFMWAFRGVFTVADSNVKAVKIALLDSIVPKWSDLYSCHHVPVLCIEETSGPTYTVQSEYYACCRNDGGTGYLYLGGKELAVLTEGTLSEDKFSVGSKYHISGMGVSPTNA